MRLIGGKFARSRASGAVGFDVSRQPADAVIVADHDLEAAPAVIERAGELRHELRRDRVFAEQAKGWIWPPAMFEVVSGGSAAA